LNLNPSALEKKTFILHLISQLFNGIAIGVILLQDIILKKSLGGTNFEIMLLALLTHSVFLTSMYGSEIVNRSSNRSKSIILIGFSGNFFLILLPFIDNSWFYVMCLVINSFASSLLLSIWNIAFKHNYTELNRSRLFSYVSSFQIAVVLITTTIFGNFLDINAGLYKIMFPAAGICGMVTYYYLAKMISLSMDDYKGRVNTLKPYFTLNDYKDILILPGRDLYRILSSNKPFLRFEIYFFLYGMAFMIIIPVVPVFLVDNLHLTYSPISFAKGLVFQSTLIIFTPLMGRYHGRGSPAKFCGYVFLLLALYPASLVSAMYLNFNSEIIVYISYFFFGLAMSGIGIAWSLSTIYYAPKNEVSSYQAAHITLTGLRGLFSPALGYLVMTFFAIEYAFFLSVILFILGGVFMFKEARIETNKILSSHLTHSERNPDLSG